MIDFYVFSLEDTAVDAEAEGRIDRDLADGLHDTAIAVKILTLADLFVLNEDCWCAPELATKVPCK